MEVALDVQPCGNLQTRKKKWLLAQARVPLFRLSELLVNCIYHLMQFASPLADTGVGRFIFEC